MYLAVSTPSSSPLAVGAPPSAAASALRNSSALKGPCLQRAAASTAENAATCNTQEFSHCTCAGYNA